MVTLLAALLLAAPPSFEPLLSPPGIQVRLKWDGQPQIKDGPFPYDQATQVFFLGLLNKENGKVGAPLFGSYELRDGYLIFKPSFRLSPGKSYRSIQPGVKDGHSDFTVPNLPVQLPVKVTRVYPSGTPVPANLLKFTLYFSGPMRQSKEIFDLIELRDDKGNPIDDPWRRTELWSENDTRLTLWFHPGRVKLGVNLREQLGPPLTPGKEYTLYLSQNLLDASGNKLAQPFSKKIRATEEIREKVDPARWKLSLPRKGTRVPLVVDFTRPLDPILFQREVELIGPDGKKVDGDFSFGPREDSWRVVPLKQWAGGKYFIRIGSETADLAGNTIERPFEVDLAAPVGDAPRKDISFVIP